MTAPSNGPWKAIGTLIQGPSGDIGYALSHFVNASTDEDIDRRHAEAEANARLMAKAYLLPEMVQVITNLLDAVTTCSPSECKGCRDAVLAGGAVLKQYEGDA